MFPFGDLSEFIIRAIEYLPGGTLFEIVLRDDLYNFNLRKICLEAALFNSTELNTLSQITLIFKTFFMKQLQ